MASIESAGESTATAGRRLVLSLRGLAALIRRFLVVYAPIAAVVAGFLAAAALLFVLRSPSEGFTGFDLRMERLAVAAGGALGAFATLRAVRWRTGKAVAAGLIGVAVCPDIGLVFPSLPGLEFVLFFAMPVACLWSSIVVGRTWSARLRGLIVALVPILVVPLLFWFPELVPTLGDSEAYIGVVAAGALSPPIVAAAIASLVLLWRRGERGSDITHVVA